MTTATDPAAPDTPFRAPSLFDRAHLPFAVGAVALVTLGAFENRATMTVLPTVARDLDGLWLFGAASAAPLVSFVVATVVAGAWADHRGPVRPLQAGMLVFLASQVAMALAPSMAVFALGRFGSGISEALMDVSLTVLLARTMPEELRAKVFAAFAAAWVLPSLVGPPVAGLLTETLSWRSVFGVGVVLLPGAWLLLRPAMRSQGASGSPAEQDTRWTPREHRAVRAAALAAAGLAALTAGGSLLGRSGPVEVLGLALVLVGAAATVPALRTVLPAGTLRLAHGIPALVALRGLVAAAFGTAGSLLPLMLTTTHGLGPAAAGASLTVTGLSWAAGSQLHGLDVVQRRVSAVRRLAVGFGLITVGVLGPALTSLDLLPVVAGLVLWGVAGLGMGIVSPTLSTQLLLFAPVSDQGRITAASSLTASVAQAVGLAAAGALIAWQAPDLPGWLFATTIAACGLVGAVGLAAARRAG
ncbi:Major Facilitator Superfamily protein [Pedococcus dokdonensis]|uniref:Major Facilitator Superfamily protein n=1 Tax=Pedococcus dokdonensis TaxID=443156 RepID=A0A1H0T2L8_9MICO|nr:MFS transporter [Pedococcus dokdonensis]SDP48293.1 Major Facilitator Superfamily protein [Pedococcus dokdonensis]